MRADVLGVKVDDLNLDEALNAVHGWLSEKTKHYIVTPNPEIIMAAQKDKGYRKLLNDADLSIPDGVGLKLSGKVENHITGVDFMEELVRRSVDWGATVGLLGGREGIAERATERLRAKYPQARIVYADNGGVVDEQGEWVEGNRQVLVKMDLLFVAFGPPKQEKWIAKNLASLDVKVAMAVGGAFDYISGVVPRAPFWIRKAGFEWLFRLITQPWRSKRQLALIKYLFMLSLRIYDNK